MTATTTQALTAGTIVRGRPVKRGVRQAVCKGIVLGLFGTDPSCGYLVWWYGKGPAVANQTVTLTFTRELTAVGTLEDLSEQLLTRIEKGLCRFDTGRQVWMKAGTLRYQKRAERLSR